MLSSLPQTSEFATIAISRGSYPSVVVVDLMVEDPRYRIRQLSSTLFFRFPIAPEIRKGPSTRSLGGLEDERGGHRVLDRDAHRAV